MSVMITPNIPSNATAILYHADNGKHGTYYIWSRIVHHEVVWYWHALGNNGMGDSARDVSEDAKEWIRNGSTSRQRNGF